MNKAAIVSKRVLSSSYCEWIMQYC